MSASVGCLNQIHAANWKSLSCLEYNKVILLPVTMGWNVARYNKLSYYASSSAQYAVWLYVAHCCVFQMLIFTVLLSCIDNDGSGHLVACKNLCPLILQCFIAVGWLRGRAFHP